MTITFKTTPELTALEKERNALFLNALKTFPNSPKQLQLRKELDKVTDKIKKLRIKLYAKSIENV